MTNELATRDDTQAIATRGAARSAIALRPDQTEWTPAQVAALRQLGLEDAPEGDLQVFFHVCQTTGLDPFRKQIHMIARKTKVKRWDEQQRRNVDEWINKYTIQIGIDGFRRNGHVAAKREGAAIRTDGPYWQGADGGGWQDVWLSDKPPAAAKFVIFRDGEAHTGIAMYREFVQTSTYEGQTKPNSMWAKMPANQIAKCAEAQAWRRAYPDDFSGMQLEDAAQVIDSDGSPVHATARRVSAGEILAPAEGGSTGGGTITSGLIRSWPTEQPADEDQADAEPASNEGTKREPAQAEPSNRTQQRHISKQLEVLGATTRPKKLEFLTKYFGRPIETVAELSRAEADELIDQLDTEVETQQADKSADSVAEASDNTAVERPADETKAGDQ